MGFTTGYRGTAKPKSTAKGTPGSPASAAPGTSPAPAPAGAKPPAPAAAAGVAPKPAAAAPSPGPLAGAGSYHGKKANTLLMTPAKVQELSRNIGLLNHFINHGYLQELDACDVQAAPAAARNAIAMYRLTRFTLSEGEDSFEKLINVYTALYYKGCKVSIIIRGKANVTEYYLCVSHNDGGVSAAQMARLVEGSFPGSILVKVGDVERNMLLDSLSSPPAAAANKHLASVSIVPSRRAKEAENHQLRASAQGIEKFIDAMQGSEYIAVLLGEPVSQASIDDCLAGYEGMYTMLSPFAKEQVSYGENESDATNFSLSTNLSRSIGTSISRSYGTSHTTGSSTNRGKNRGSSSGLGGFGFNSGSCWGSGTNVSDSTTNTASDSESTTDSRGSGTSEGDSHTTGTSRTVNLTRDIKSVQSCMQRLDSEITRINLNRSFGMWNCCCYVVAASDDITTTAASNLVALMSGDEMYSSTGYISRWNYNANPKAVGALLDSLACMQHPRFINKLPTGDQLISPALMVSGRDLPVMMGMPGRSVIGTEVLSMAPFGRNFPANFKPKRSVHFGRIMHMGLMEKTEIELDLDKFASHCFICGASGSGKSNTTYNLLDRFYEKGIKFLVIEPAKGEYKTEFAGMPDMTVFTCKPDNFRMLFLNPFEFCPQVNIMEHMAKLNNILRTCWPLYGPMPSMLKQAVEEAYIACGWDLRLSKRVLKRGREFPTFADLLPAIDRIIDNSPYPASTKGEYKGALSKRVAGLLTGFEGVIFGNTRGISDEELFNHNVVVDLSSIGDTETRSLIMGILITKLREFRFANHKVNNASLQHVTVLEEAHNIFKRCNQEQSQDSGNVQGASVSLLVESIAEMRTCGEGFMIIDQSPSAVDIAALKNTAIKIVMRLPEEEDCKAVGSALSLLPEQIREISRLPVGVAAIYHEGWTETVMGKMGDIWSKNPHAAAWRVQPGETVSADLLWARGAIVQWIAEMVAEEDLTPLSSTVKIEMFIKRLKDANALRINENQWNDLISQVRQFVFEIKDSPIDLRTQARKPVTERLIGGFLRRFLQIDDMFRLLPLETKVNPEKDEVMNPTAMQQKAFAKWWKEIRSIIGNYIVMPVQFDDMAKGLKWNAADAVHAQYMRTVCRLILQSYANTYHKENEGDYRYTAALFDLWHKYLEE